MSFEEGNSKQVPPPEKSVSSKIEETVAKETVCFLCSIPTAKSHMQKIALERNQETIKTIPETPVFTVLSRHKVGILNDTLLTQLSNDALN